MADQLTGSEIIDMFCKIAPYMNDVVAGGDQVRGRRVTQVVHAHPARDHLFGPAPLLGGPLRLGGVDAVDRVLEGPAHVAL